MSSFYEDAAELGRMDGEKSAIAAHHDLRDDPEGQKPLRRDEAESMAAACASARISHGELSAEDRDEYEEACVEAHLAAWPVRE